MPYISAHFIEKLLDEADIVKIIEAYCHDLKKKGAYYFCRSPFTNERTASMCVRQQTQTFKDYSSGKGGNAISFLMAIENASYTEAVVKLARLQNMVVEYEDNERTKAWQEKQAKVKNLSKYIRALNLKFQEELRKLPKEHPAWQEIKKREYTDEVVKDWEIGYAPGNKFIYGLFKEAGAVDFGKQLGLINDNNQDKLWNRLTYPIYDKTGNILGFASRDLSGEKNIAKWMNPSDSDVYSKSATLFALDRAKVEIAKSGKAWVVEGYNDVIAWHENGIYNTVAPCGTALTQGQIALLAKSGCAKIILCMDPDAAGQKATMKLTEDIIASGMTVKVCKLPDLDPDDYVRRFREDIKIKGGLSKSLPPLENGFALFLKNKLQGDELDRANGIKDVVKLIAKVDDISLRDIYMGWLAKESKSKQATLKQLLGQEESKILQASITEDNMYLLPKGLNVKLADIKPIIEKYQLFMAANQIFIQATFDPPYTFKSISNFSIEILQHMYDEKFPMKLLKMCNTHNEERIFDAPADALTTPLEFKKLAARQGNYKFKGNIEQLDKVTDYLYEKMGTGRKIDILGWNPEGFYCTNNTVIVPGQPNIPINKNGIFHFSNSTFYVPSANEIYRQNPYKFQTQKKIVITSAQVSMADYLSQIHIVHREFGIVGMLFAFASAHQDLITQTSTGFPIFFLCGPPSTGKDQLFSCIKRMFGLTETDFINLENEQSTGKAQIRSFAELSNMVVHLSEFTNANPKTTGLLKGLWDRGGYKRGTIDSNVSTDTVPILSSVLLTGNESPVDDAVLTRLLYGEMDKNRFNDTEKAAYDKLQEMNMSGITEFMQKVIWYRPEFESKFPGKFKMYKKMLAAREAFEGVVDRVATNFAILGATYEILKDTNDIVFPFTFGQMVEVFDKMVLNLKTKLDSASIMSKWWDVFIAVMRGNVVTQIRVGRDMKLEGSLLYFNFTNVYNRIQQEWRVRYNELIPGKMIMLKKMKEQPFYHADTASTRMSGSESAPKTSAIIIDINKIAAKEDLLYAIQWQKNEGTLFEESPATPNKILNEEDVDPKLPF